MITENYCNFEIAKLLKEKGFKEITQGYINADREVYMGPFQQGVYELGDKRFPYPTHQMALKWLREVHNMYIEVCTDKAYNLKDIVFRPAIYNKELNCLWESDNFSTYEEAVEAAIEYCLENLV